jgi:hypothetical protein
MKGNIKEGVDNHKSHTFPHIAWIQICQKLQFHIYHLNKVHFVVYCQSDS